MDVANDWGDAPEKAPGNTEYRQRCKDFIDSGGFNVNAINLGVKDLYHPGMESVMSKWDPNGPLALNVSFPDTEIGRFGWQFILASLKAKMFFNLEVFEASEGDGFIGFKVIGLPSFEEMEHFHKTKLLNQAAKTKDMAADIEKISKMMAKKHVIKAARDAEWMDKFKAKIPVEKEYFGTPAEELDRIIMSIKDSVKITADSRVNDIKKGL